MNTREIIEQAGTHKESGLLFKKSENYQIAHKIGYLVISEDVEEDN